MMGVCGVCVECLWCLYECVCGFRFCEYVSVYMSVCVVWVAVCVFLGFLVTVCVWCVCLWGLSITHEVLTNAI
jgi:hypothetical protein